jgi:hypothetical protein
VGVVPFQTVEQRAGAADLRATAEAIIDRLGNGAGWFVGATARSKKASPEQRERLSRPRGCRVRTKSAAPTASSRRMICSDRFDWLTLTLSAALDRVPCSIAARK